MPKKSIVKKFQEYIEGNSGNVPALESGGTFYSCFFDKSDTLSGRDLEGDGEALQYLQEEDPIAYAKENAKYKAELKKRTILSSEDATKEAMRQCIPILRTEIAKELHIPPETLQKIPPTQLEKINALLTEEAMEDFEIMQEASAEQAHFIHTHGVGK